jgi:2-hydroxycyclohexanecarboxyl-CoA dehydrogenase
VGKLDGKVALITGAGSGIGRGVALAMASEGADIAVLEINATSGQETVADILERGKRAVLVSTDVRSEESCHNAVATAAELFGGIDVLVNNAMQWVTRKSFLEHENEDMVCAWESGVMGSFWLMKAVHPYLVTRGGGSIINFGSSGGTEGQKGYAGYAPAKEGIRALTKVAAREWGKDQIRVNVICPAAASPRLVQAKIDHPDEFAAMLAVTPLGRVGDPEMDIGRVAAFLASDDSSYLTAETLMVDGGLGMYR